MHVDFQPGLFGRLIGLSRSPPLTRNNKGAQIGDLRAFFISGPVAAGAVALRAKHLRDIGIGLRVRILVRH